MNFELTDEVLVNNYDHDDAFVREPFNLLEGLLAFIKLNVPYLNETDITIVINRTTGESCSFSEVKDSLNKLYYRNVTPSYEEFNSPEVEFVDHPILNPDLMFQTAFGNFIDFQAFNQTSADGGFLYYDFRYNQFRENYHSSTMVNMYRSIREEEIGKPLDFSFKAELDKK